MCSINEIESTDTAFSVLVCFVEELLILVYLYVLYMYNARQENRIDHFYDMNDSFKKNFALC